MSLRTLELGTLHLVDTENHLKLSVLSTTDIRIPQRISSLANDAIIKALTSGNLWVSRGVGCRLDIQILFNGKKLDRNGRIGLLESLGYRFRDAQLWSQLSILASLDIWQSDDPANLANDLSIKINHGEEGPIPQIRRRAWTLNNVDIKPSDSVLCAGVERVQIQFNFLDVWEKVKLGKRVKSDTVEFDAQEVMLLDFPPDVDSNDNTDELAHTVEGMKGLSGRIQECFDSWLNSNGLISDGHSALHQPSLSSAGEAQTFHTPCQARDSVEARSGKEKIHGIKRSGHSKETIETLNVWLSAHRSNPYPSVAEKRELMRTTGLKLHQINNWFQHHRRRLRGGPSLAKGEIPLQWTKEEPAALGQFDNQEDDEMLFSQNTENFSSLTSQASVASSMLLIGGRDMPLKRPFPTDEAISLHRPTACELGDIAFHLLVSGHIGRASRGLAGIQVETPPPNLSLSSIAPATFCPGFKMSMAHNAQFVPTISHTVSVSWPRNVQSPGLQQKLTQLANSLPSLLTDEIHDGDGESGEMTRIAAVVQSRLWGIMQRKLYDPSDAAKIWKKPRLEEYPAKDEGINMLDALKEATGVAGQTMINLGEFLGDEMDEFEDLLSSCDDELLGYLEEPERLSIERETDEMLFGSGWDGDEQEQQNAWLLDGEAVNGIMLI